VPRTGSWRAAAHPAPWHNRRPRYVPSVATWALCCKVASGLGFACASRSVAGFPSQVGEAAQFNSFTIEALLTYVNQLASGRSRRAWCWEQNANSIGTPARVAAPWPVAQLPPAGAGPLAPNAPHMPHVYTMCSVHTAALHSTRSPSCGVGVGRHLCPRPPVLCLCPVDLSHSHPNTPVLAVVLLGDGAMAPGRPPRRSWHKRPPTQSCEQRNEEPQGFF